MKQLGLVLISLVLAGCASGPLSGKGDLESGARQAGIVVQCNGAKAWDDCDRYASEACSKGYEVLAKEENVSTQNRSLRISCK